MIFISNCLLVAAIQLPQEMGDNIFSEHESGCANESGTSFIFGSVLCLSGQNQMPKERYDKEICDVVLTLLNASVH